MPFAFSSLERTDARQVFARQASYAFAVLCFGAVGVAGCVHPVIELFLPADYQGASTIVAVLVLGITIQATTSFTTTSLNVAKRTSVIPVTAAAGAIGSLAGCLVFVPRLGVLGAALGVLCGQTAFAATTAWYAQRSYRIPYEIGRLAKVAIVSTGLVVLSSFVHVDSPWVDLLLSLGLVAMYPVLLWAAGFVGPIEKNAVRKAAGDAVTRWTGLRSVRS
jgi:O-antigen/teichoic acid export membrane protein